MTPARSAFPVCPLQLRLTNQPNQKQRVFEALQEFARKHQLPQKVLQAADLALEEHLTNVLNYAYKGDNQPHEILVRLELIGDVFQVEVEDDGTAFDPLSRPEPDFTIPLSERPIGGLGVHLIRRFMDEVAYRRTEGKNILQMRKRLG